MRAMRAKLWKPHCKPTHAGGWTTWRSGRTGNLSWGRSGVLWA